MKNKIVIKWQPFNYQVSRLDEQNPFTLKLLVIDKRYSKEYNFFTRI